MFLAATAPLVLAGCSGSLALMDPRLAVLGLFGACATQLFHHKFRETAEIMFASGASLVSCLLLLGGALRVGPVNAEEATAISLDGSMLWLASVLGLYASSQVRRLLNVGVTTGTDWLPFWAQGANQAVTFQDSVHNNPRLAEAVNMVEAAMAEDRGLARVVGCRQDAIHGFLQRESTFRVAVIPELPEPARFVFGMNPLLLLRPDARTAHCIEPLWLAVLFDAATRQMDLQALHTFWHLEERRQRVAHAPAMPGVSSALAAVRRCLRGRDASTMTPDELTGDLRRAGATLAFAHGMQAHPKKIYALLARLQLEIGTPARRRWKDFVDTYMAPPAAFFARLVLWPAGMVHRNDRFTRLTGRAHLVEQTDVGRDPLLTSLGAMDYLLSPSNESALSNDQPPTPE